MSLLNAVFSFVSGALSSMGFGGGTVLIIFLTLFLSYPQQKAQGINLMFYVVSTLIPVIIYQKKKLIDKKRAITLGLGGACGVALGYFFMGKIPTEYLSKLFGGFVIIVGIKGFLDIRKRN